MHILIYIMCVAGLLIPRIAMPYPDEGTDAVSVVRIQSEDGSYYVGQVKDGLRHGRGRQVSADGSEYQGEFMNGEPHGNGIYYHPDGRRKKVVFQSGKLVESRFLSQEGGEPGCIFGDFVSLGRYSGWYKGNKVKGYTPHGRGIMRYFNGSVFSGQWEEGRMHGNGSVTWEDGAVYTGQWIRGKRTGFGTYRWSNGDTYVGEWKENQMCGKGVYYSSSGKIKKMTWNETTVTAHY
ncbi:MAG TPA: hypothetical protein PLM53_04570 [Spirochaetota bacterium]|nr:hypothetical protein [Spirochaetota bacterium]HPC42746.1 hypothetical protein [Spirochaetota bacterium]HQF07619.1 hypothetical protein [Spirochaetota bacterium]HQH96350.1 hypothetical protein [Spirochaetota bacterium]HQJ69524.1 hypothetical protein [Spirochaetota bacterium]